MQTKNKKNKRDAKKIKETLGSFIKEKRNVSGFSQAELAAQLGYTSPQFVSDWERGISAPPMKKLPEIAKLLNVEIEILFELLVELATLQVTTSLQEEFKKII